MPTKTYEHTEQLNYVIHDRPIDKLPLRRLQVEGPEVLTINELLHVSLGSVDGIENTIPEYGAQFLTTLHSVSDAVEALKIDHMKASKLIAALELGKRLYSVSQGSLVHIRGIEDVFNHYRTLSHLAKEQMRVLLINSRHQLIHEEILSIGSTESLQISPKDVFQAAVERRVTAIILVHNHPSGDPAPSQTDLDFTRSIRQAGRVLGIELLDHVIIGRNSYASCVTQL